MRTIKVFKFSKKQELKDLQNSAKNETLTEKRFKELHEPLEEIIKLISEDQGLKDELIIADDAQSTQTYNMAIHTLFPTMLSMHQTSMNPPMDAFFRNL